MWTHPVPILLALWREEKSSNKRIAIMLVSTLTGCFGVSGGFLAAYQDRLGVADHGPSAAGV